MESTPEALSAASYAKVNLFLEVTGRRPDGYHDLESVFVEIDLRDHLLARRAAGTDMVLELPGAPAGVPADGGNLAARAAAAVRRRGGVDGGLRLTLRKNIPPGSGLGGGSANAAAALRLADALYETQLGEDVLAELALELGSDVPFFLRGGTCLCQGRGEIITRLPDFPTGQWLILALPPFSSDTASAFRGLTPPTAGGRRTAGTFVRALSIGDAEAMEREAFNRFEKTVFARLPELGRLRTELAALCGRRVGMSGSGSSLWHFADAGYAAGLAGNRPLADWAAANRVRLEAVRARPATAAGRADILLDTPRFPIDTLPFCPDPGLPSRKNPRH